MNVKTADQIVIICRIISFMSKDNTFYICLCIPITQCNIDMFKIKHKKVYIVITCIYKDIKTSFLHLSLLIRLKFVKTDIYGSFSTVWASCVKKSLSMSNYFIDLCTVKHGYNDVPGTGDFALISYNRNSLNFNVLYSHGEWTSLRYKRQFV